MGATVDAADEIFGSAATLGEGCVGRVNAGGAAGGAAGLERRSMTSIGIVTIRISIQDAEFDNMRVQTPERGLSSCQFVNSQLVVVAKIQS